MHADSIVAAVLAGASLAAALLSYRRADQAVDIAAAALVHDHEETPEHMHHPDDISEDVEAAE